MRAVPTRRAEMIEVIRTVSVVGAGIDGDPVREVVQYWSLEGVELAMADPFADEDDA